MTKNTLFTVIRPGSVENPLIRDAQARREASDFDTDHHQGKQEHNPLIQDAKRRAAEAVQNQE